MLLVLSKQSRLGGGGSTPTLDNAPPGDAAIGDFIMGDFVIVDLAIAGEDSNAGDASLGVSGLFVMLPPAAARACIDSSVTGCSSPRV